MMPRRMILSSYSAEQCWQKISFQCKGIQLCADLGLTAFEVRAGSGGHFGCAVWLCTAGCALQVGTLVVQQATNPVSESHSCQPSDLSTLQGQTSKNAMSKSKLQMQCQSAVSQAFLILCGTVINLVRAQVFV